jgi:hypothetical protein
LINKLAISKFCIWLINFLLFVAKCIAAKLSKYIRRLQDQTITVAEKNSTAKEEF